MPDDKDRQGQEFSRCPDSGVNVKHKNLRKQLRRHHRDPVKVESGPLPGPKAARRDPGLRERGDDELAARVRQINLELKGLAPGFHGRRIEVLEREKGRLVRELKARQVSGVSDQWGRWYKGPGRVRHWRSGGAKDFSP